MLDVRVDSALWIEMREEADPVALSGSTTVHLADRLGGPWRSRITEPVRQPMPTLIGLRS